MRTVRFGVIGLGLMGREFASAAARWCHLTNMDVRPEIVAVCTRSAGAQAWCREHLPAVELITADYSQLMASPAVEAVYVALPHNLHQEVYIAAIDAGKHLMGEKPFGIDLRANQAILACVERQPQLLVRCCSQFPFLPAVQKIGRMIEAGEIGTVIEVETGFLHSSDLDPAKKINWKRQVEINGEYGVMGDLGMHACHVPFRAGWRPQNVRAVLSKIVSQRPDATGQMVPCQTWDNATLLCETLDPASGAAFPWTFRSFRIAPGEQNTWYLRILGTKTSVRFSTKNPKRLELLRYAGQEQIWGQLDVGMETAFPTITGRIFEPGFSDSVQQMWAAYLYELQHGRPLSRFAGCVTPEETHLSHCLFTAAAASHRQAAVAAVS